MEGKGPTASTRFKERIESEKTGGIVFLNHPGQVPFGAGRGSPGRGSVIVSKEASNNGNAR